MISRDLANDGAVIVATLGAPARGVTAVLARRRSLAAVVAGTAAALLFAVAVVPRVDYESAAAARLDAPPKPGEKAPELTPHERDEALATAHKLGQISLWVGAALGPALAAAGAAAFLWLAFRVAGTRPGFRETFAVTAHGLLPIWLAKALSIPAALARSAIPPEDVGRLLPSSAAELLPRGAPAALAAALSGLDLFALWAVALVALAMARASGATRTRSAIATALLYAAYVAVVKVALPAAAAQAGGGQ